MPRGDKSSYSGKQRRQAEHIEESEKKQGRSTEAAERIAWATVNKQDGGAKGAKKAAKKSTSKKSTKKAAKKPTAKKASRKAATKKTAEKAPVKKATKKSVKKDTTKIAKKAAKK